MTTEQDREIIDVWMQHPTMAHANHPMFASLRKWMGLDKIEQPVPLEMTLGSMKAAGVSKGLISAWYGPDGALISNEFVQEAVEASDGMLAGVAGVDVRNPVQAVQTLRSCVQEHNFVALRIVQWLWEYPPTHRLFYPLYAACVDLGVPVCLQVGHTGPLKPSETGRPIPYVDQVALDFPDLKIVCGHIGYPWTQEMIAVATKHENVYIDTSAYTAKRYPPELVQYLKTNGKHKVMFGTNFPMILHQKCLTDLPSLELGPDIEKRFLSENAKQVFAI